MALKKDDKMKKYFITAIEAFKGYGNKQELKDGEQQLIINVINYADTPEGKEMQKQIEKEKYGELYIDEAKADKKGII